MNRARWLIALIFLVLPSLARAADDPLASIGQLMRAGKVMEARAKTVALRDGYAAANDAAGEAASWLLLAMVDSLLHDGAAVRDNLAAASAKFAAADDAFGGWLALMMLAQFEKGDGRFEESLAVHARIAVLLREAAEPKARLSIDAFRLVGAVAGAPVEGLEVLSAYAEVIKPILLAFAEVMWRDEYACVLLENGELEKAEQQLQEASSIASRFGMLFGGAFDATIEAHKGTLRLRQWRLEEARASYTKALDGAQQAPRFWIGTEWVEVEIMTKLATLEVLSGRTDEGLAWNDRALAIVREAKNTKREASLLQERGTLLQNAGRLHAAHAAFEDALKLATANEDTYQVAVIHSEIGALRMFEGMYGSAIEHLEKSLELFQRIDQPYVEAPIWTLLAEVYLLLETPDAARLALERSRALAEKSGFKLAAVMVDLLAAAQKHRTGDATTEDVGAVLRTFRELPDAKSVMLTKETQDVLHALLARGAVDRSTVDPDLVATAGPPVVQALAMMIKGMALLERGQYAEARTLFQRAKQTNPSGDHGAGLLALIGASYWREGKRDQALTYFRQSAQALDTTAENVKVEELLSAYLGGDRRWYFALLIEMLTQEGHAQEAFAHAERARARAFLQLVGNHRLNAEHGAAPALVREAEALRMHIAQREREAKNARGHEAKQIAADLALERQRYQTVLTRVKASNPEYASLTSVEPLPMPAVQKELPPDSTLISYFVSPNAVHAWTITATDTRYTALPLDKEGLQRIVCWASQFRPDETLRGVVALGGRCSDAATAEEAFDALMAPLLDGVATEKLVLVPHGVLHYVPFAALRDRKTGRYLIQTYTLSYVPSASTLRFLRAKASPISGRALVFGEPATPLPLRALPFAKREATAIASQLGTTPYVAADAREALLYRTAGKVDLIHLAAHGLYDGANPLFSRIALAPGDGHDGSLTVHEILSSVDLTGVNLVVLSACLSAVGARSGGDEVVGLTRALLYAGTPAVVSTLWSINDAASADLMEAFYRCLGEGKPAAAALREAQLEVLQSESLAHPKYWAAFMLTGDPQVTWKSTR